MVHWHCRFWNWSQTCDKYNTLAWCTCSLSQEFWEMHNIAHFQLTLPGLQWDNSSQPPASTSISRSSKGSLSVHTVCLRCVLTVSKENCKHQVYKPPGNYNGCVMPFLSSLEIYKYQYNSIYWVDVIKSAYMQSFSSLDVHNTTPSQPNPPFIMHQVEEAP